MPIANTTIADRPAVAAQVRGWPFSVLVLALALLLVPLLLALRHNANEEERRIKESAEVLATTANAFAEDKARCLAAGMDDFLVKPFNPDVLFTTLLEWLAKT